MPDTARRVRPAIPPETSDYWGVEACQLCGVTLVLGDESYRARVAGRTQVVCSECAMTPAPERPRQHPAHVPFRRLREAA
jgi:hypothetical protein